MSRIEKTYREEIARWPGYRRVERSAALLSEVREMIARRVLAQEPGLGPDQVARRVAESLYRSDKEALRLLALLDS